MQENIFGGADCRPAIGFDDGAEKRDGQFLESFDLVWAAVTGFDGDGAHLDGPAVEAVETVIFKAGTQFASKITDMLIDRDAG